MTHEEIVSKRNDLAKVLDSLTEAEARQRDVADSNRDTMRSLQQSLSDRKAARTAAVAPTASPAAPDRAESDRAAAAGRAALVRCSQLSTRLVAAGRSLRIQRLEATNAALALDALLVYRQSARSAFVLRHTASLGDHTSGKDQGGGGGGGGGLRLLSNGEEAGSLSSFRVVAGLGKGSFGAVFLVQHTFPRTPTHTTPNGARTEEDATPSVLAMKMVLRETVSGSPKRSRHLEIERRVMAHASGHPFIVSLHYALQSPQALFFVMDYCAGGDLFFHLCRLRQHPQRLHPPSSPSSPSSPSPSSHTPLPVLVKHFTEAQVAFFAAQVVSALGHLHDLHVVYRDLKPENVMLDGSGYVRLVDFGLAKEKVTLPYDDPVSPCGSAMYVAPEVLGFSGGFLIDWWSLGVLVYELLTGSPPWNTKDRKELFKQIREVPIRVPKHVQHPPPEGEGDSGGGGGGQGKTGDFMLGLLHRNPAKRLGAQGDAAQLKASPFFDWCDWDKLHKRQLEPPFRPCGVGSGGGAPPPPLEPEVNFDGESSAAALGALDSLHRKMDRAGGGEGGSGGEGGAPGLVEASSFVDFEPVVGRLACRPRREEEEA